VLLYENVFNLHMNSFFVNFIMMWIKMGNICRRPRLCVSEKVLRFAQRHVESSAETTSSCVLVGTLNIDDGMLF